MGNWNWNMGRCPLCGTPHDDGAIMYWREDDGAIARRLICHDCADDYAPTHRALAAQARGLEG